MKAKDIMIPFQDYLKPESILREAVNLLRTAVRGEQKKGVMGLPVLDKTGKVVYMSDIFYAITKAMLEESNGGEK